MPASEAQIRANQANAQKSSGPKSTSGKEASRANALKHGLTATKVFPEREAAEVQRRYVAYCAELKPSGEVGFDLTLRAATLSARMERCVEYETAMLTERVRRAEADFVPPAGVDAAEAFRLRQEAGKRALFDDSKEAILARKYEASAERGFFRCLKELRQHEKTLKKAEAEMFADESGSFLPEEMTDEEFDRLEAEFNLPTPPRAAKRVKSDDFEALKGRVDVPFAIGKPR
jgi:hypothetical protein